MSISPPSLSISQPYNMSTVSPQRVTYHPDGSYTVSQSRVSYSSTQQGNDTPLDAGIKKGVKSAFSPKGLGLDAVIGGLWVLAWKGVYALSDRMSHRPPRRGWDLTLIPMMMGLGAIIRGVSNGYREYDRTKNPTQTLDMIFMK